MQIAKVISGAQTGVDLAALDAALALDIPTGGWVPSAGCNEVGPIDLEKYNLTMMPSGCGYPERTRKNIETADATILLMPRGAGGWKWSPGSLMTVKHCQRVQKSFKIFALEIYSIGGIEGWLKTAKGNLVLNFAGPRESKCPGAYETAFQIISNVLLGGNAPFGDVQSL